MVCMKKNIQFYSLAETVDCASAGRGRFPVGEGTALKMQIT